MRLQWRLHKFVWNLSGGRLGRRVGGMPVVEVMTLGHKSGEQRQILIWYVEDQGRPAIVGSNAGSERDPAWVLNLRAHPEARARWDGRWHDVIGIELTGEDRVRAWAAAVEASPVYDDYAANMSRAIPVFRLDPLGEDV